MADPVIEEKVRQYDKAESRRAPWDSVWREIAKFMRPTRVVALTGRQKGARVMDSVYDATAIQASQDFASALNGTFTSDAFQWFALRMRLQALNELHPVTVWLEDSASRMYLAFQQSNFSEAINEVYLDLAVFGTGCLLVEERPVTRNGFNGFQFKAIPPGSYVIVEGPDGSVRTFMRKFKMTIQAAVDRWGLNKLSEKTREQFAKEPLSDIEILHVVEPSQKVGQQLLLPRAFESTYIEHSEKHRISKGGFHTMPYLTARWTKTSDEEYGRGQGHVALPDVRTLNRAIEMRFKAWAKAIDPPMKELDDGVIGRVRLTPGSRNVVRQMDALSPIEQGARFDVASFQENELRTAIRNYFFSDRLQLPNKNYMTAFEIQQQIEIMQRFLGPQLGRLKNELFSPLIDRAFDEMIRKGALLPPPQEVVEASQSGQGDIDVHYESPLIRTQRSGDLVAFQRTIEINSPLFQINPRVMDNIDEDEAFRHNAAIAGIPAKIMRPKEAVAQRREQAQQAEQAQSQNAQAEQASVVAKNFASAGKDVSKAMPQQTEGDTPVRSQ